MTCDISQDREALVTAVQDLLRRVECLEKAGQPKGAGKATGKGK